MRPRRSTSTSRSPCMISNAARCGSAPSAGTLAIAVWNPRTTVRSTSFWSPVSERQRPGRAAKVSAYCLSFSGVSRSGSTLIERSEMLPPCSSGIRRSWSFFILACSRGQASEQEVKTKSAIHARPSRSPLPKALPSSETSEKAGRSPSVGRSAAGRCRSSRTPIGTASASAANATQPAWSTSFPGLSATGCMTGVIIPRGGSRQQERLSQGSAPIGQQALPIEEPHRDPDQDHVRQRHPPGEDEVEAWAERDPPRELDDQQGQQGQHGG